MNDSSLETASVSDMVNLKADDLEVLASLTRAGLNESFHHGIAVLVNPAGEVISAIGNVNAPIYPRSALKPIQALAMRNLGLQLPPEQTVMTMASHHGTARHTQLVDEILESHGLNQDQLQCPADLPWNVQARQAATKSRLNMNCSGKHAGFIAAAKLKGLDVENYLSIDHPVQVEARRLVEELSGEKVSKVTVDGCGAPLFAISTLGLARAISGFVKVAPDMVEAAIEHPMLIGDEQTPDAAFLRAGLFSKLGAEGVFTVATTSGYAVAIKIADGSLRAAPELAIRLLKQQGLIDAKQEDLIIASTKVIAYGGGEVVGGLEIAI